MKIVLLIMISFSLAYSELVRDDAQGVVFDPLTKLVWQDDGLGATVNWEGALQRCENLNLSGRTDWRLPNINELITIVDRSRNNPAIINGFAYTSPFQHWSSTTDHILLNTAYTVSFYKGMKNSYDKSYFSFHVRCVRDEE